MLKHIVADIGANHNKDMGRAEELIHAASVIGCTAAKFQLFNSHLWAPGFPHRERMQDWELPMDWVTSGWLYDCCQAHGIEFHCTVFFPTAVDYLGDKVDALKIGSYEVLLLDLIKRAARAKKPLMLSSGNCDVPEMSRAVVAALEEQPESLLVYHCVSHYPARPEDVMLRRAKVHHWPGLQWGWSDHTVSRGVMLAAVALGANALEFHLDLDDREGQETKIGHVWSATDAMGMIDDTLPLRIALGDVAGDPNLVPYDDEAIRRWRTDPEDGMRPLRQFRAEMLEKENEEA